ncbi:uncharacterized protein LOC141804719 [Halichoeres trimaculatus]|uniref:uncharacterized protein LOC141804719 n=1 Tax=Halichoeres trimaculatus TaxID=147232 RepID=UPI003D9EA312
MACEEPAILYLRTNIVICVGLFLVSTSFCHGRGLTKLKALDKSMGNHTLAHIQMRSPELHHGRLLIGKNKSQVVGVGETEPMKNLPGVDKDYLADMGWEGSTQHKGQINSFSEQKQDNSAVEQLLKMEPKVECTKDSMKLQVQDAASYPGSLLFVDRGSRLSPLPLNKLPQSCGYSIQSTRKDLVLVAPYDGCFVSLQEDTYVLPLRWWGLPVRMSCPLMRQSSPNPPLVTCHAEGMIVKTEWTMSTDKIKVKLSGDWKPLMTASSTCRFGVVAHPEGVVISVHFAPCLQEVDGMYTLELAGDGEIKISCPSLPPAGTEQTKYSVKDPQQKVPSKGMHPPAQSKENQAPQIIDQHSYFPSYPNYVIPGKPDSKPAEKPVSPPETGKNVGKPQQPVDPSVKQPVAPKGQDQQLFYQYPYYPLPPPAQHPVDPPVKQPAAPKGQDQQLFYQYPYYPLPPPAQHPVDPPVKQPVAPKGQDQQLSYQYPYYPLPPPAQHPVDPPVKQPVAPKGQDQQLSYQYPYYPLPPPAQHPVDPPVKQPAAPKGQDQQLSYQYPYYPLPPPAQHPVDPPVKQPVAPKGQDQQLSYQYPYYPLPPPAQHPVDPPVKQPVAPKGQDQQLSYQYPYYPLPPPASKPSQPQAPKGQIQQSFVSQQEPEKPAAAQKPSKPAAPKGQVNQPYPFYLYPFYSQSESENKAVSYNFPSYPVTATEKHPTSAAKPQQPETPQGQGHQQFYLYPYHFHPGQDSKNPAAVKPQQAPQPEAPKGQVQWPFFPKQDHEEPPAKKPATVQKPSQPEAPQSQVHQQLHDHQLAAEKPAQPQVHQSPVYPSFYHPYFFHQPQTKNPPAEKPAGAAETSQPSKPALTQSHENQFAVYQYPLYPKPDFGKQPATGPKEPLHQKEPQKPEGPHLPQYKPFYPYHYPYGYPYSYPFYSQPGPSDQLTAVSKPSSSKSEHPKPGAGTDDNISTVKNPQQPQYPEYVTLPPDTSIKDHHQASSLPSTPDNQKPSKGGTDPQTPLHKPPVYCPQYCPSGLSSCCVQIAFHQHLHHILPAKETPQFYSGLPFLPSVFYSGSDQGLVSAPFPQKSTDTSPEAPPSSTSVSSQSLSVKGNHQFHQPPDALKGSDPSKPTTQKQIYIVPHPVHPYPAYLPQHEGLKFPQSQLPAHYIVPSQSQALGKGQVNQVFQHPVTSAEIVSKEQRPSDIKSSDSGAKLPQVIGDPNRNKLLRYLLQNSQGFTDHSHSLPPQPSVRTLQEPNHQPANNANPEPQSFVLLPHGPPGRESNGFNRSPLPSTDLIHDAHHQSYKPQHPQNPQQPEWLGEGMSNPSPENMNDMTRNGDESGSLWHISAPTGPHFVPLPQDPSSGTDDLKPQFPDFSKPMAPDSSGQNVPPFVHPEAFQQWSPAADEPQNGFYQPSEEDGGTQR